MGGFLEAEYIGAVRLRLYMLAALCKNVSFADYLLVLHVQKRNSIA